MQDPEVAAAFNQAKPQGALSSFTPTLADRLRVGVQDILTGLGVGKYGAQDTGAFVSGLAGMLPVTGNILAGSEIGRPDRSLAHDIMNATMAVMPTAKPAAKLAAPVIDDLVAGLGKHFLPPAPASTGKGVVATDPYFVGDVADALGLWNRAPSVDKLAIDQNAVANQLAVSANPTSSTELETLFKSLFGDSPKPKPPGPIESQGVQTYKANLQETAPFDHGIPDISQVHQDHLDYYKTKYPEKYPGEVDYVKKWEDAWKQTGIGPQDPVAPTPTGPASTGPSTDTSLVQVPFFNHPVADNHIAWAKDFHKNDPVAFQREIDWATNMMKGTEAWEAEKTAAVGNTAPTQASLKQAYDEALATIGTQFSKGKINAEGYMNKVMALKEKTNWPLHTPTKAPEPTVNPDTGIAYDFPTGDAFSQHIPKNPVDEATRQANREAGGFITPLYHGTKSLWFDTPIAQNTLHFSTPDADLAGMYAAHKPYYTYQGYQNVGDPPASQIMPLYANTKDYHVVDAGGLDWTAVNNKAVKAAKQKGAPGVRIDNVWDEPATSGIPTPGEIGGELGAPKTVYINLDPTKLRSAFAQFDPAKWHLNDLLAGLGGFGLLAPGVINKEQTK